MTETQRGEAATKSCSSSKRIGINGTAFGHQIALPCASDRLAEGAF